MFNKHDFYNEVRAGFRPTGPDDYGPSSDKVQIVFAFLKSNRLLRFSGKLDEKFFIPVSDIKKAEEIAFDSAEEDFLWHRDAHAIWTNGKPPPYVFDDANVWKAFKKNLFGIQDTIGCLIDQTIPEEYRFIVYDEVLADLLDIASSFAKFGQLDELYALVWEAYQQGGWPCGLTGCRPIPTEPFSLENRKLYVFWK